MKNLFNSIKLTKPTKSMFDLTHDVKMTCDMGNLIPVCTMEAVPGDKFTISAESLIRFSPLIAPVMHRMDVSIHYFFVPNRILWDQWEKFITDANSGIAAPFITVDDNLTTTQKKLMDYIGIPPFPATGADFENVNALPLAAYQAIYHEYYRDQNLIDEFNYKLDEGDNTGRPELITLRKRAWEHDYFTSCLPFAQKGEAVDIPLGDVVLKQENPTDPVNPGMWKSAGDPTTPAQDGDLQTGFTTAGAGVTGSTGAGTDPLVYDPNGSLITEATTINELRRAFRLQEWLEKNARGGTRYIESILSHFGVRLSDKRLQRPEYITGIKTPVVVSEVLNTTGESGGLPQGNMAGHGIAVTTGKAGSYFCEEHGFIIGVMSIMPKTAYQQGIHKQFLKRDPLDYYWPSFAHIGEQEVQVRELFAYTNSNVGDQVFGYIPRYAEYKYMPSRVAGNFRDNLDYWHLGRKFASVPLLNQDFIECDPEDTKRIFAVEDPDTDSIFCHVLNKIQAVRPMPKFGTPMM